MQALVFGKSLLRTVATKLLGRLHPRFFVGALAPTDRREIPEPALRAGWVTIRTTRCGLCGCDYKQAFSKGNFNNPMTALVSFPQVLGHEVVGYVAAVGSHASLEVDVCVTRARGRIVVTGVEVPREFEWTPLYFREIVIAGSNGFAVETYDGRRQPAMEWYCEFLHTRRIDVTPIIPHRFALQAYRDAFLTCWDQGRRAAVKVLFEVPAPAASTAGWGAV